MLTDPGDFVIDPFAGSCATGEVCERLGRRWVCVEVREDYLSGALGRFRQNTGKMRDQTLHEDAAANYYKVPRPGILWNDDAGHPLPADGGRNVEL